jgi:hypothetical protein
MKYLKTKNISKFSISDDALVATPSGRYVMDGIGALRLPKGTAAQRPDVVAGVHNGPDGYLRYNTDTNSIEAYINGYWQTVRAPSSTAITKERFGPGNGVETVFGPLVAVPVGTGYRASGNNIIVLVENVMQIFGVTENFTVQQSVSGSLSGPGAPYADGWYVKFTSAVPNTGGGGNPVYVTVYHGYAD